jgi:hypothetical protein
LNGSLDGPQSCFGCSGEEKNFLLLGIEPCLVHNINMIMTVTWLQPHGYKNGQGDEGRKEGRG